MKRTIGLIVNPIAGMGGSVGLKGTDGESYRKALDLGAQPVAPSRTKDLFDHIRKKENIKLLLGPAKMGEIYVSGSGISTTVVGSISDETSSLDTKRIAKEMVSKGVELLIFVGGDGTARDICDAIGLKVPVVAVPSGVKIFSAVFAFSARSAAAMIDAFTSGTGFTEEEVLDIDEAAFRENRLASKLYGYLLVPDIRQFLQGGKECSQVNKSAVKSKEDVARDVIENIENDAIYLLGPGTTVKAIADACGIPKTLLGVDALANGQLVGTDLNEKAILSLFHEFEKRYIVVTPIGGNGFIFGRGSKQFTPEVIRLAGRDHIIIVATRDKLANLEKLRVDTGDFQLDQLLSGYIQVIIGYKETLKMEIKG